MLAVWKAHHPASKYTGILIRSEEDRQAGHEEHES